MHALLGHIMGRGVWDGALTAAAAAADDDEGVSKVRPDQPDLSAAVHEYRPRSLAMIIHKEEEEERLHTEGEKRTLCPTLPRLAEVAKALDKLFTDMLQGGAGMHLSHKPLKNTAKSVVHAPASTLQVFGNSFQCLQWAMTQYCNKHVCVYIYTQERGEEEEEKSWWQHLVVVVGWHPPPVLDPIIIMSCPNHNTRCIRRHVSHNL